MWCETVQGPTPTRAHTILVNVKLEIFCQKKNILKYYQMLTLELDLLTMIMVKNRS